LADDAGWSCWCVGLANKLASVISFVESSSRLEFDILDTPFVFGTGWLNISLSKSVLDPLLEDGSAGLGLSEEGVFAKRACKPSQKDKL